MRCKQQQQQRRRHSQNEDSGSPVTIYLDNHPIDRSRVQSEEREKAVGGIRLAEASTGREPSHGKDATNKKAVR